MAPRRFSSRERTLALGAALVIGVSAMLTWLVGPLWSRLESSRSQADVSQQKVERLRRLVARRPQIERAAARADAFRSEEPPERLQAELLRELEGFARASNVQLALKPRPRQESAQAVRFTLELQVDGAQVAVLGFVDRVCAWPRLLELERIRLSTAASPERPLRANVIVTVHVLPPRLTLSEERG